MMGTKDKTLFCFCHYGGKSKVLSDGSTYVGGVTDQIIVKTGIKYNNFVNAVFDRLGIDPSDKILHFTVKYDRSELIRLRDQEGVDTLLQYNDGCAHVYVSSLEKEPYSRTQSGGTKIIGHTIISDTEPAPPVGDDQNDNECGILSKAAVAKLPPHQVNQEPFASQNNVQNGLSVQFSNLNHHQYKQPTSSATQETFWTKCHTCKLKYKYYGKHLNRFIFCQKCLKPCIAYDIGSLDAAGRPKQSQPGCQDMPLKSNLNKPFEQRELPNQETSKMPAGSARFLPSQTGSQQDPEICRGKTALPFEDILTKQKVGKLIIGTKEGAVMPKVDHKSRKRIREQIVESSKTDDTLVGVETEVKEIGHGNSPPAGQGTRLDRYYLRRSAQHRQRVSNNEGVSVDDNDLASRLKKGGSNQSAGDSGKPLKGAPAYQSADQEGVDADQEGVDTLLQIYASSLEKEPYSLPPSGGTKIIGHTICSDTEPAPPVGDQNDNECGILSKAAVAKLPPHQVNQELGVQFSNLNHRQYKQPTSSAIRETFWTKCPTCKIKYKYYNNRLSRFIFCQKCLKPFIAYDTGSTDAACRPEQSQPGGQDMPLKSNLNKPFDQRDLPNQETLKMTAGNAGFLPSQTGSQQDPEICRGKTPLPIEDILTKLKDEMLIVGTKDGAVMPKVDHKSRKRIRERIVESNEINDTLVSVETEVKEIGHGNSPPAGQGTRLDHYNLRRSAQHRQHVSNNKGVSLDENDLASRMRKAGSNQSAGDSSKPRKRASAHQSAGESKSQQKEAVGGDDQKHAGVTRSCSNSVERLNQNGGNLSVGDVQKNNTNSKIGTVDKHASDSKPDTTPDVIQYPSAEFNDFDKHKVENCVAVNQIWACYDTADCMPRFYVKIMKVSSPEFKIKFSCLGAYPENQRERAWVSANLPVGCGKFKCGTSHHTSDRLIFSHQVQYKMGKRGLYAVYPMKGETWALFKGWDIHWSSDPGIDRKYTYEIVEILSDYVGDIGVQVGYLDKVTGFASLYERTKITAATTFCVKPNELYKFSHRIPSFKMSGTEREGVPVGCFELELASLPLNPDDIWCPKKVKEECRTAN